MTRWIWHIASESASTWFVHLQNTAFKNAALGKRDWVITILFIYLFGLGVIFFFAYPIGAGFAKILPAKGRIRMVIGRVRSVLLVITSLMLVLLLIYNFGRLAFLAYVDLQLNASFSQRLDALSPYIEPMEERRLRSQWALMKTRVDYERINARIEELAIAAKIAIPEPLLK